MALTERSITRLGDVMFYLGGAVWVVYAICKYALAWDVTIRQFLPFHLAAIIPGVLLRHGSGQIVRLLNKSGGCHNG